MGGASHTGKGVVSRVKQPSDASCGLQYGRCMKNSCFINFAGNDAASVSAAKTDGRRRTSASVDDGYDELTLIFFARHRAQASWERRSRRGSPPPLPLPVPPSPDAPASSVFLRFLLGAGTAGGGGKARAGDISWSSSPLESIFIAGPGITVLLPLGPSRLRLALLLGGNMSPMATQSRFRTRSNLPS